MKSTGDILTEALDLLKIRGWTRRQLQAEDGSLCANGAINTVITGEAHRFNLPNQELSVSPDYWRAARALVGSIPVEFNNARVAHYNNSRQSFSEIEAWFQKAIVTANAEEGMVS